MARRIRKCGMKIFGFKSCHVFMAAAAAFILLGITFSSSSVGGGRWSNSGTIGKYLEPFEEKKKKSDDDTENIMNVLKSVGPKEIESLKKFLK